MCLFLIRLLSCIAVDSLLTVEHTLINCVDSYIIQQKIFCTISNLTDLFHSIRPK